MSTSTRAAFPKLPSSSVPAGHIAKCATTCLSGPADALDVHCPRIFASQESVEEFLGGQDLEAEPELAKLNEMLA